jgi:hypothetical protein
MSLLRQIGSELYSMFVSDAVMTALTLAIVLAAAALRHFTGTSPTLVGFGVLLGCLSVLIVRVLSYGLKSK